MYTLLILAVSSLCAVIVLTPLVRNLATRFGFVDQPDHIRKFHTKPVPRVGGIPIFIAYLISFAILLLSPLPAGHLFRSHFDVVWSLFPAAMIVFLAGLLDDLVGLRPWQKLGAQILAAAVAVGSGVQINTIAWHQFPSWLAIPVTILWLVGCANAFNLIDGLDGLAAGIGLLATTITLIAALLDHNIGMAIAIVPLVGALLGFLRFNFNPASIFLGDSGSLFVGFLLGCYSVLWSQKSATILGMTAPLIALSIPLLDTGLAIVRRFLRGQPIFGADHGHIHHRLLALGLTPRRVAILLYLVCGLCGALSLLQSFAHEGFRGPIILVLCVGACVGVRCLKYKEFEMARRIVLSGGFRRHLNAEIELSTLQDKLTAAATADQCWEVLQSTYTQFGFNEIRFKLGGRLFTHTSNGHHIARTWTVRINLSESDYLNLSREFATEAPPIVSRFTDAVGSILCSKASCNAVLEARKRPPELEQTAQHVSDEQFEVTA